MLGRLEADQSRAFLGQFEDGARKRLVVVDFDQRLTAIVFVAFFFFQRAGDVLQVVVRRRRLFEARAGVLAVGREREVEREPADRVLGLRRFRRHLRPAGLRVFGRERGFAVRVFLFHAVRLLFRRDLLL